MQKIDIKTTVPAAIQSGRIINSIPQTLEKLGGISRSMVYELINQGELAVVKIGRRSFITEDSLQSFVQRLGNL